MALVGALFGLHYLAIVGADKWGRWLKTKRYLGVLYALAFVFSLAAIGLPSPVQAATFTVNSMGDAVDCNPGHIMLPHAHAVKIPSS